MFEKQIISFLDPLILWDYYRWEDLKSKTTTFVGTISLQRELIWPNCIKLIYIKLGMSEGAFGSLSAILNKMWPVYAASCSDR
jgi:hypothetical protein